MAVITVSTVTVFTMALVDGMEAGMIMDFMAIQGIMIIIILLITIQAVPIIMTRMIPVLIPITIMDILIQIPILLMITIIMIPIVIAIPLTLSIEDSPTILREMMPSCEFR